MSTLDDILSGQRRDMLAVVARLGLSIGEPFYWLGSSVRNWLFDKNLRKAHRANVPVVSIGNLTTGGTGKSPVVRWIVESLLQKATPVILSRGYRATEQGTNDEYEEMRFHLPDVVHLQNPDRVASAEVATAEHGAQILILDDGFQHRRLFRDLDIVLIDVTRPFGHGHLLPRGMLREPIASLRRADLVILTRCDHVPAEALREIIDRITQYVASDCIAKLRFAAGTLCDSSGFSHELSWLNGKSFAAFCGIGNPSGFKQMLKDNIGAPAWFETFSDHHHYTAHELQKLAERARDTEIETLVCTMKDLVKVRELPIPDDVTIVAITLQTEFISGEAIVLQKAEELLQS